MSFLGVMVPGDAGANPDVPGGGRTVEVKLADDAQALEWAPKGSLLSDEMLNRAGQPPLLAGSSSAGVITLSFQGLRKLDVDSMLTSEALDALLDACFMNEAGVFDTVLRRSRKDDREVRLPGFRILSRNERSFVPSPPKAAAAAESCPLEVPALWRSFESKNLRLSSKESDFGRGMVPRTVEMSKPCAISTVVRNSIASLTPPALLRVYDRVRLSVLVD